MMRWKDMTGEERFRVVEMARQGERSIVEICRTFEVSRQTLHKAMEQASQAAMKALEPQKPGRKAKSEEQLRIGELVEKTTGLEKEVSHWKTRFEVAHAFIDLTRKTEQKEKRSRKKKKKRRHTAKRISGSRSEGVLASLDDGRSAGDRDPESGAMDE
jgi:transposase-like protein